MAANFITMLTYHVTLVETVECTMTQYRNPYGDPGYSR